MSVMHAIPPDRYKALRESLGDRKRAARFLRCAPVTIRFREEGRLRITEEAAERLRSAVHTAALDEDARRDARQAGVIERRAARTGMLPAQFEACLSALGWTRKEAAQCLLADPGEAWRITAWALGRTIIPEWVARHMRDYLGLAPGDPWPAPGGETRWYADPWPADAGHRRRRWSPTCPPRSFRYALHLLGWSQTVAAERLGIANRYRVSDWCRGARPVPPYVEAHLRTQLAIGSADPWPRPPDPPLVLPGWMKPPLDADAG